MPHSYIKLYTTREIETSSKSQREQRVRGKRENELYSDGVTRGYINVASKPPSRMHILGRLVCAAKCIIPIWCIKHTGRHQGLGKARLAFSRGNVYVYLTYTMGWKQNVRGQHEPKLSAKFRKIVNDTWPLAGVCDQQCRRRDRTMCVRSSTGCLYGLYERIVTSICSWTRDSTAKYIHYRTFATRKLGVVYQMPGGTLCRIYL